VKFLQEDNMQIRSPSEAEEEKLLRLFSVSARPRDVRDQYPGFGSVKF
jgi:hypothetical protein